MLLGREGSLAVILEAFAQYLRSSDSRLAATSVLSRWLWERLTTPAQNNVDRVIKCEIGLTVSLPDGHLKRDKDELITSAGLTFYPLSKSGGKLLRSLYEYALSYEQQRWSRWVHCLKASDFNAFLKE